MRPHIQVRRDLRLASHQRRPGHATVEDIREDHPGQRPGFMVLHLDIRCQANPSSPLAQPVAQFNILDRRLGIALRVEGADGDEALAAHRATASPEGRGISVSLMMDEVVEEVFILGDESGRGRGVVV